LETDASDKGIGANALVKLDLKWVKG
jgi:hypothetical protein